MTESQATELLKRLGDPSSFDPSLSTLGLSDFILNCLLWTSTIYLTLGLWVLLGTLLFVPASQTISHQSDD